MHGISTIAGHVKHKVLIFRVFTSKAKHYMLFVIFGSLLTGGFSIFKFLLNDSVCGIGMGNIDK